MCSSYVLLNTTISSRHNRHEDRYKSPMQDSISLWNVAGALVHPKGMALHSQKPKAPAVNAVFSLSSSSSSTCQYALFKSSVENQQAPPSASSDSSIRGREYASLIVTEFRRLKSMQKRRLPSFFLTKTMLDA